MAYELEIIRIDKDGTNGHIAVLCRVHDTTDAVHGFGALDKFGISAAEITDNYGGDVSRWITEAVGPPMVERHKARVAVHTDLTSLKGKRIPISG